MKKLIKMFFNKDVMLYVFFGVLTTICNFLCFFILNNVLKIDENLSNIISICLSVLFAFFTNRTWVFHSQAKGAKEKFSEFFKFVLGRTFTMLIEFFGCMILFKTELPTLWVKAIISVIVIILNFFISKFFAFKKIGKDK